MVEQELVLEIATLLWRRPVGERLARPVLKSLLRQAAQGCSEYLFSRYASTSRVSAGACTWS